LVDYTAKTLYKNILICYHTLLYLNFVSRYWGQLCKKTYHIITTKGAVWYYYFKKSSLANQKQTRSWCTCNERSTHTLNAMKAITVKSTFVTSLLEEVSKTFCWRHRMHCLHYSLAAWRWVYFVVNQSQAFMYCTDFLCCLFRAC